MRCVYVSTNFLFDNADQTTLFNILFTAEYMFVTNTQHTRHFDTVNAAKNSSLVLHGAAM